MIVKRGDNLPWYKGETLLSMLENTVVHSNDESSHSSFPIQLVSRVDNDEIKLNNGDIILEVNREIVVSIDSFTSLVEKYKETGRSSLLLKIQRGEETSWVTIKFVNN